MFTSAFRFAEGCFALVGATFVAWLFIGDNAENIIKQTAANLESNKKPAPKQEAPTISIEELLTKFGEGLDK